MTAPTGPAAGSCPEVVSVVIWRLSLDRSISRYLYSPATAARVGRHLRYDPDAVRTWFADQSKAA
ncbi:hypothetical protein [Micromonospora sp. NPDC005299]|uniref:hypothetical protein n=1 Tax=Micromonospora sp. NPDC005299 TaxID=3364231 RepID=UPI00368ABB3D